MAGIAPPSPFELSASGRVLRMGVCGLSRGFLLARQAFLADPRIRLIAAADPRPEARAAFETDFGGRAYADLADLLADAEVEAVYIASPHGLHAEQAIATARAGKSVLVEKPMALTLADCGAMTAAAREAGVSLVVGPSHSFDPPVVEMAAMIGSGAYGPLRMVTAMTFTDFLLRPRRPEELDTAQGGGVVFSQAVHQIDVVRRLAKARCRTVRAFTGRWDPARPTEGAYQALLGFETEVHASLTYGGHARFDTAALMEGVGEMGEARPADAHARTRRALVVGDEATLKAQRAYSAPLGRDATPAVFHEHFGFLLAGCDRADLRTTPAGVEVFGDGGVGVVEVPRTVSASGLALRELWEAVVLDRAPLQDGAWGAETLAVALAMLRSSAEGREIEIAPEDVA